MVSWTECQVSALVKDKTCNIIVALLFVWSTGGKWQLKYYYLTFVFAMKKILCNNCVLFMKWMLASGCHNKNFKTINTIKCHLILGFWLQKIYNEIFYWSIMIWRRIDKHQHKIKIYLSFFLQYYPLLLNAPYTYVFP